MESIRSFVAIELAAPVIEELSRRQERLRAVVTAPVKWVRAEGVHLTLKFLGNVETDRIGMVREALARAAAGIRPFPLALGRFGAFPSLARPRVFWIGIEGDVAALARLQKRVEEEIGPLGFPTEPRGFQAHLTLGRASEGGPRHAPFDASRIEALAGGASPSQTVDRVSLMRSVLRPEGAVYSCMAEVHLR